MAAFALTLAELSNCNRDIRSGRDTVSVSVLGQVPWEAESGWRFACRRPSSSSVKEEGGNNGETENLSYQEFANEASACLTGNCTGIALQSHPESRQGGCALHRVLDTGSSWGEAQLWMRWSPLAKDNSQGRAQWSVISRCVFLSLEESGPQSWGESAKQITVSTAVSYPCYFLHTNPGF